MRYTLLASAVILSGTTALAHAQAPANPSQGQYAAPYGSGPAPNNNNNSWGIANTPSGSAAAGSLSTIYSPNTVAVPAPGTIVIHLNGRVQAQLSASFTSSDKGLNANGTPNGYKLNPVGLGSYVRLYPGFDAVAANGLRYGASVELRQNFYGGTNYSASGTGSTSSPSGNTSSETIYVRRAFAYLASDKLGIVRLGQADGVLGLFDNCIFTSECWDAGLTGLNGGASQAIAPSGPMSVPWAWISQSGADYGNSKIVYMSPQFYGFDFGVQYAPNEGNSFSNASGSSPIQGTTCNQAGANCINVSSGNDATRWLNQVGVGLRFQRSFGPVDFKTYGFYETAGKEDLTTTSYVNPSPSANASYLRYDNLSFYKAGVAVTAANLTAAVDYIGGAVNGSLAMRPTGGASTNAVLAGLTYANGPIMLGADVGIINSQGAAQLTGLSQRHETEFSFGGSYKLAPGVQLVGEYMYTQRHQGGYDFNQGAVGVTRDAKGQGVTFATVLTW
ncbi:MAG: porin [Rhodopila sp.]|nr:porin [Rhodopila sp.]